MILYFFGSLHYTILVINFELRIGYMFYIVVPLKLLPDCMYHAVKICLPQLTGHDFGL